MWIFLIFLIIIISIILSKPVQTTENFIPHPLHRIPKRCINCYQLHNCPNNCHHPPSHCPYLKHQPEKPHNEHRLREEQRTNPAPNDCGEYYYCNLRNQCIRKKKRIGEVPYCGSTMLYNTLAPVYQTREACENAKNPFRNLTEEQCLKKTGAGWCTDYLGNGICLRGTPWGPDDMYYHNTCYQNQVNENGYKKTNAWRYGFGIL